MTHQEPLIHHLTINVLSLLHLSLAVPLSLSKGAFPPPHVKKALPGCSMLQIPATIDSNYLKMQEILLPPLQLIHPKLAIQGYHCNKNATSTCLGL